MSTLHIPQISFECLTTVSGITVPSIRYCLTRRIAHSTCIRSDAIWQVLTTCISALIICTFFLANGGIFNVTPLNINLSRTSNPLSAITASPSLVRRPFFAGEEKMA